jgi:hypothetical protein
MKLEKNYFNERRNQARPEGVFKTQERLKEGLINTFKESSFY